MRRFLYTTDKYDDKYYSNDFQCPVTGVPVCLVYNETRGSIYAEICELNWNKNNEFFNEKLDRETKNWIDNIFYFAVTKEEANKIAFNEYNCWFE